MRSEATVVRWGPVQVAGQDNEPVSNRTGLARQTPPLDQRLYENLSMWAIFRTVDQELGLDVVESMVMEA